MPQWVCEAKRARAWRAAETAGTAAAAPAAAGRRGPGALPKKKGPLKRNAQIQENSEIIWDSGCNLVEFKLCGFGTCKDHSSFGWSKHILSCRDLRRLSIINSWWCSSRCWCNKQRWYSHFGPIGQHLGWEVLGKVWWCVVPDFGMNNSTMATF